MDDYKALIQMHAVALWRYRWYGVVVAWFTCVAGWLYVAQMPNRYESNARVYIDAGSMLRPLMRGIAIGSNIMNEVDMVQRTLLSRPNLQKVARMTDLDLGVRDQAAMEALIASLEQRIRISAQGAGRNLFNIRFEDNDPKVAQKVVQSLLNLFVESNLGNSRRDMAEARRFIDGQIREYELQLQAAEDRAAEFKARNLGLLPGDGNYFSRLEGARGELQKVQAEITDVQHKRDELRRQLASVPQFIEVAAMDAGPGFGPPLGGGGPMFGGAKPGLENRIAENERSLEELRQRYTEQHPDVVIVLRRLEKLRKEFEEEQQKAADAAKAAELDESKSIIPTAKMPNPVYQQLKIQLVDDETTLARLESRRDRARGEVEKFEKLARSVPGVAAEMARLNRDYEIMKKNYEDLVARREAARIGQELEAKTDQVQFRIIEPPIAPSSPTAPNRPLFHSVALFAGLAAGVVFAFFLSQIDSSIRSIQQLKLLTRLPILGGISTVNAVPKGRRWMLEASGFAAILVALLGAYAAFVTLNPAVRLDALGLLG